MDEQLDEWMDGHMDGMIGWDGLMSECIDRERE